MTQSPAPIASLTAEQASPLTHLLFDFDDTVTWDGQLPEPGAQALYRAAEAGFRLIAVTGRSAAWGEMLMRLFPLDAAIAETGAICYHRPRLNEPVSVLHSIEDPQARQLQRQKRLNVAHAIMKDLPQLRLALDNVGRIYDSAFDLVEDGPSLPETLQHQVHQRLEAAGLHWAQSSVHINFFWEPYEKPQMVQRYFEEIEGRTWQECRNELMYFGDSTNDGPLFRDAPLSTGVANIAPYLPILSQSGAAPKFITQKNGGYGFAEAIGHLIHLKNA